MCIIDTNPIVVTKIWTRNGFSEYLPACKSTEISTWSLFDGILVLLSQQALLQLHKLLREQQVSLLNTSSKSMNQKWAKFQSLLITLIKLQLHFF